MFIRPIFHIICCSILVFPCYIFAQENESKHVNQTLQPVKHYQVQNRYQYGARLLALAFSKLDKPYEIEAPKLQAMNEARGELEIISGRMDVQWVSTTASREIDMIPVKVPLYRGILGLRLLLTIKERSEELKTISSIEDLRKFVGGHGLHWGDLPIYQANNLKVVTHVKYQQLFEMLIHSRFDYFHRGVNEIWDELSLYNNSLNIVDEVMLFYPHPVYFFVSKHRPDLAVQLEKGLRLALDDGSFKELFLSVHGTFLDKAKLDERRLVVLTNPVLPDKSLHLDTSWWLPTKFDSLLK